MLFDFWSKLYFFSKNDILGAHNSSILGPNKWWCYGSSPGTSCWANWSCRTGSCHMGTCVVNRCGLTILWDHEDQHQAAVTFWKKYLSMFRASAAPYLKKKKTAIKLSWTIVLQGSPNISITFHNGLPCFFSHLQFALRRHGWGSHWTATQVDSLQLRWARHGSFETAMAMGLSHDPCELMILEDTKKERGRNPNLSMCFLAALLNVRVVEPS